MTIQAAKLLDQAFEVYLEIARVPDGSVISRQSPSWEAPKTPYDFASLTVRSLIPFAYNFDPKRKQTTEDIYVALVEAMEVLPFESIRDILELEGD